MMKLDPVLTKAVRFARRGRHNDAITLLESEENRYFGSFTYNYLLGLSYLHTGVFGAALSCFKRAREQKMRDPGVLLGIAALYLNHGDTDRAIDLYLEVQDLEEHNPIVKRALRVIRKNGGAENISAWIESGRLHTLFPPLPKTSPGSVLLRCAGITALLCSVVLGLAQFDIYLFPFLEPPRREGTADTGLVKDEIDAPMQTGGSYRYVLTKNEVLQLYNDGRKLFTSYHDEAARVSLNRILESNAAEAVKNRARTLLSFMEVPGFDTLRDRFAYGEIIREPILYRDCHVIWRGMATNLRQLQNSTSFDFLVGYDTRRTMEGIVRIDFNFAIPVNPERPLEILGRVVPVSTEKGEDIRIEGIALNQAGLLDNPK
jgi:tetratricopeptide (TPR) repeat protein